MNQQTLFKPLSEYSKAAVVETANALIAWSNEKDIPKHLLTAIAEYYEQLARLANETSILEKDIEDEHAESITKSDV